jgi:hypothetical protein
MAMLGFYYAAYKTATAIGILLLDASPLHQLIALIFFIQSCFVFFRTTAPVLERKEIAFSLYSSIIPSRAQLFSFLLILCSMTALFMSIGIPGLADDANVAKTQLQNHPVLARWYRFFLPACVILITWEIHNSFAKRAFIQLNTILFFLFMCGFGLALGFKGYVISYLFIPFGFAALRFFRIPVGKTAAALLIGFCISSVFAAFVEKTDMATGSLFVLSRITLAQGLGPDQCINAIDQLSGYPILQHDLSTALFRLNLGGNPQSFNAYVFELLMGENPYGMEVTVPWVVACLLQFGTIGLLTGSIVECAVMRYLIRKSNTVPYQFPLQLVFYFLLTMTAIDLFVNGVPPIRLMDFAVSVIIFWPFLILVDYLLVKRPARPILSYTLIRDQ